MSFHLVLPIRVNANARGHSFQLGKKVKIQRQAALLAFRPKWRIYAFDNRIPKQEDAQKKLLDAGAIITLTRLAPRELDGHDNLRTALKPTVDGIADALGLKSDRDPRVEWLYAQAKSKSYGVAIDYRERVS